MFQTQLEAFPIWLNAILFAMAAAGVWVAGVNLSQYADAISDRLRIGKATMGLIFLAAATSLPELVTTITASIQGNAALVLNNMFGGITMQTAILAVADATLVHATLTFYPRKPTPVLEGALLCLLLAMLLAVSFLGDISVIWNVGIGALFFSLAYWLVIRVLRDYDQNGGWHPVEIAEEKKGGLGLKAGIELREIPLQNLYWLTAIATLAILVIGVFLVSFAETLAAQSGLGSSFIGVTLLAAATSLPELSTTITAVRLGAYTMAISNIFGSNLIILALLLPADIFYRDGVLLNEVDRSASFALISGLVVTAVYICGLIMRRKRRVLGMGLDSLTVLSLYLLSLVILYHLR